MLLRVGKICASAGLWIQAYKEEHFRAKSDFLLHSRDISQLDQAM
jgi:hypothetical protein